MNDATKRPPHGGYVEPMHESQPFKKLEDPGAMLADVTPYLYPHDVAKIFHDAYRSFCQASGDPDVPEYFATDGNYQMELTAAVETMLSPVGGAVAPESDTVKDLASAALFLGLVGALKPFVIPT